MSQAVLQTLPQQAELDGLNRDLRFHPCGIAQPQQLTRAQIAAFTRDGYIKGIRVFSAEEIAEHRRFFDELLAQVLAAGGDPYSISTAHLKYGRVYDLLTHPRIVAIVRDLLGENVIGWVRTTSANCPAMASAPRGIRTRAIGRSRRRRLLPSCWRLTMLTARTPACATFPARTTMAT